SFLRQKLVAFEVKHVQVETCGHGDGARVKSPNLIFCCQPPRLREYAHGLGISSSCGESQSEVRLCERSSEGITQTSESLCRFLGALDRFGQPAAEIQR